MDAKAPNTPPARRRFTFGMRSLLCAVTLIAVACAISHYVDNCWQLELFVAKRVELLGGACVVTPGILRPFNRIREVDVSAGLILPQYGTHHWRFAWSVDSYYVPPLDDESLCLICSLPSLHTLKVRGATISLTGENAIAGALALTDLDISGCTLATKLDFITSLPALQVLHCSLIHPSNQSVEAISRNSTLREVYLDGWDDLTLDDVTRLLDNSSIRLLYLRGTSLRATERRQLIERFPAVRFVFTDTSYEGGGVG
jgi:hypothetical protein